VDGTEYLRRPASFFHQRYRAIDLRETGIENEDMGAYYSDRLAADRLRRVYEIAPPRVRQYLDAEVEHVLTRMRSGDKILDLGCGYGRIIPRLAAKAALVVGIDTSEASLGLAGQMLASVPNCLLVGADALALPFDSGTFDVISCIQNGISAFHVDHAALIAEAVRVIGQGGIVLFSTYSDKFWDDRLAWFQIQSEAGLLGEMDYAKTGDGVIACKDGFVGTAVKPDALMSLTKGLNADASLIEVDESSLFLEIVPR
jgi:2-polyprenyl-6-hydroxyphenyl methylase/3-demethylubiquinone-9 3-methyltransferase